MRITWNPLVEERNASSITMATDESRRQSTLESSAMRRTPGGRAVNDPGRSGNAVIPQKYTLYRGNLEPSEEQEEEQK